MTSKQEKKANLKNKNTLRFVLLAIIGLAVASVVFIKVRPHYLERKEIKRQKTFKQLATFQPEIQKKLLEIANQHGNEHEKIKLMSIEEAAIHINKEQDSRLTPENGKEFFDKCVQEIKAAYPIHLSPEHVYKDTPTKARNHLGVLNEYLYGQRKIRYIDITAEKNKKKSNDSRLSDVMFDNVGTCTTMPLMYKIMGERLNIPVFLVGCEDHFFLRWENDDYKLNLECTSGGKSIEDKYYIEDFDVREVDIKNQAFMKSLDREETLGHLFASRASYYYAQDDEEKVIRDLAYALLLNPYDRYSTRNMALMLANTKEFKVSRLLIDRLEKFDDRSDVIDRLEGRLFQVKHNIN